MTLMHGGSPTRGQNQEWLVANHFDFIARASAFFFVVNACTKKSYNCAISLFLQQLRVQKFVLLCNFFVFRYMQLQRKLYRWLFFGSECEYYVLQYSPV